MGGSGSSQTVVTPPASNTQVDEDAAIKLLPNLHSPTTYSTDPCLWAPIDNDLRDYWVTNGPAKCNNRSGSASGDYAASVRMYDEGGKKRERSFYPSLFQRQLCNGEFVNREWLLYSPSKGSVYCFVCRLFSTKESKFSSGCGYSDWKHAATRIAEHETSPEHNKCMLTYCSRHKKAGRLDTAMTIQFENEQKYWRNVLQRIVAVVRFLCSRGLPFRGENEILGSQKNGNYLGTLELISEFDPFLKEHIRLHGNAGKGNPSYLSATVCDEFITLMGKHVMDKIISELKSAKYYSLSVDSTPDISHTDQLSIAVRYVLGCKPIERFMQFVPIYGHSGENLCSVVTDFLAAKGISLQNCRGQSYDNAANMSGKYSGLQARLKELNPLIVYVPCAGHSLNLVGNMAAGCCENSIYFFDFVQRLYIFFAGSTHRWAVLTTALGPQLVVKRLIETRWSARRDAVHALFDGYDKVKEALIQLANDMEQTAETRLEASKHCKTMEKLETAILLTLWHDILTRFDEVSKVMQKNDVLLATVVKLFESLRLYIDVIRDQFAEYETKAKSKVPDSEYSRVNQRQRKRSTRISFFDGPAVEAVMDSRAAFKVSTFLPIIDSLKTELERRGKAYTDIHENFGFLVDQNRENLSCELSSVKCHTLASVYKDDLVADELASEYLHFQNYCQIVIDAANNENKKTLGAAEQYSLMKADGVESVFPNVEVALRIYLSLMVSNCFGERSFSRLKLLKSPNRSTMLQDKLNCFALMSIENDLLQQIDFDDVIADFASLKSRKTAV